jgi:hypothetical protein
MRGRREERIEKWVDRLAALALAVAVAVSLFALLGGQSRTFVAPTAGFGAYILCVRLLGRLSPHAPKFEVRTFSPASLAFDEPEELLLTEQVELLLTHQVELLLTDAERLRPEPQTFDELVLDDILAKLGPQSRVVRLFDPAAMPTPGQLNARIERHLQAEKPPAAPTDAAEDLYQALSDLRRSLR